MPWSVAATNDISSDVQQTSRTYISPLRWNKLRCFVKNNNRITPVFTYCHLCVHTRLNNLGKRGIEAPASVTEQTAQFFLAYFSVMKKEAVCYSETSANIYWTTRFQIYELCALQIVKCAHSLRILRRYISFA
jgi:hypothetical protein